tara:strand:+ start:99 stop:308 length:210 start_codon:yes stop_codon:yes gene_type:complete
MTGRNFRATATGTSPFSLDSPEFKRQLERGRVFSEYISRIRRRKQAQKKAYVLRQIKKLQQQIPVGTQI